MPETFTPDEVALYYNSRMPGLKPAGSEMRGPCAVHKGKRPSFAVNRETGTAFCHSKCGRGWDILGLEQELTGAPFAEARAAVFQLIGRTRMVREPSRVYDYLNESGELLFQTVRFEPKNFRQRQPNGKGGWVWNLRGVRLVPYRIPELVRRSTETVFVCEGEKDVHSLERLGVLATCNPMGAGKWRDEYSALLAGRRVVVLPDNDPPTDPRGKAHFKGQRHAAAVAESLLRHECSVRLVELPNAHDASDWIANGGSSFELTALGNLQPDLSADSLTAWRAPFAASEGIKPEWPDPLPLQSELPAVRAFDDKLLPVSFRPLVVDLAERMQVPMDYPAISLVLCLAGVVNRRALIQPKEQDSGWVVVPNLWGGIIGPPGYMKSPVIQAAVRPLQKIQSEWRKDHEAALENYAHQKEECELRLSAWKELYKRSAKNGGPTPPRPDDEPSPPKLQRLIVNDATFEALHETMNENPAGILVVRDELTGWWSTLDKAGREGERAFCLQAWNGDTGHTIDRIGRGTIHVEACCMSMLGGIQPARLRSYLVDALHDGPSNDGLIQRFQLLVWPDTEREWRYVDRPPDAAAEKRVADIFRLLISIDPSQPLLFRFDVDAQQLFKAWLSELEATVRSEDLHAGLVSHLSKYRSLMPSLALLFELADRAAQGRLNEAPLLVPKSLWPAK